MCDRKCCPNQIIGPSEWDRARELEEALRELRNKKSLPQPI